MLDILNDGTFTVQIETPNYVHPVTSNEDGDISIEPVQNNQNVTPSRDTRPEPQKISDNQWSSDNNSAIDNSNTIEILNRLWFNRDVL